MCYFAKEVKGADINKIKTIIYSTNNREYIDLLERLLFEKVDDKKYINLNYLNQRLELLDFDVIEKYKKEYIQLFMDEESVKTKVRKL